MSSVGEEKAALRSELRARRTEAGEAARAAAADRIGETLVGLLEGKGAVMAFLSFADEVPTDDIVARLHEEGHAIAVPHVDGDAVVPIVYAPGDPVEHAVFGIREPAQHRPIDPKALDAVLVPGLAFDPTGHRVGYGGGFYDRLLPLLRPDALRIGIGLDLQVVPAVPTEDFDLPVDLIVTEARTIEASEGSGGRA